jgi:integrase
MSSGKAGAGYKGCQLHNGKIRIWFAYQGERCFESLNLLPTQANWRAAARLRAEIVEKIRHGLFNYSDYFPDSPRAQNLGKATFGAFTELWLQGQTHLAKSTLEGYRKSLDFHLLPKLAHRTLESITHTELMALFGSIPFQSAKTRNNTLIPLRRIFDAAYLDGLIPANPAARIRNQKVQKDPPDPLSLAEVEAVLIHMAAHYPEPIHSYFEFAFFTGMRTSELIALQWADIDWTRRTATVQRAKVRHEIKHTTKTSVRRDVELNSRALAALERQRKYTQLKAEWIFLNPNTGEPFLDDRPVRRWAWTPTLKALGLRHRECYQTRHTYATIALMSGANPAWAAAQLGHSTQMFLNVYSRWIAEADGRRELSKLEAMIGVSIPKPGIDSESRPKIPATGTLSGTKAAKKDEN